MSSKPTVSRPQRQTRQRAAIVQLLEHNLGFTGAQSIRALLAESGTNIGQATVYRTLAAMVETGEVDTILSDTGELLYRRCSPGHHHHLVCRRCGTTVEVHDQQVERWADDVAQSHGFSSMQHNVEIVGICANCAGKST